MESLHCIFHGVELAHSTFNCHARNEAGSSRHPLAVCIAASKLLHLIVCDRMGLFSLIFADRIVLLTRVAIVKSGLSFRQSVHYSISRIAAIRGQRTSRTTRGDNVIVTFDGRCETGM
jgi:hypothetical protein